MSYKTVYICDGCKAESESTMFLTSISVSLSFKYDKDYGPTILQPPKQELCRDCLACLGVLLPEAGTNWGQRRDAIVNEPSVTEKFVEATCDLIQNLIDIRA